jgi:ribosome-associated toxin RatA of RatAB toxin-antitoxin module
MGTVSMTFIASPHEVGAASGLMDAFTIAGNRLGLLWVAPLAAILLIAGSLGGTSVWAIAPLEMLENTHPEVLPDWLRKRNDQGVPQNALFFQAILVTIIVAITSFLPSVATIYQILVSMTTLTYFIPYIGMLTGYVVLMHHHTDVARPCRIPGPAWVGNCIAAICLASVGLAIAFSLVPPPDLHGHDALIYLLQILMGPLVLGGIGLMLSRKTLVKALPLALLCFFLVTPPSLAAGWEEGLSEAQISAVKRGEVAVRLRSTNKASLKFIEAIGYVNAPVENVWHIVTDYGRYPKIYGGILQSEVKRTEGLKRYLYMLLDYPWPFQDKWVLCETVQEPQNWTIGLHRVDGSVKEVDGSWHLYPVGSRTMVVYSILFDPGLGFIPPSLLEWGASQAIPTVINGLRSAIKG